MRSFEDLLASSAKAHGHLCPGQAIGVRMAVLGCRLVGLDNPSEHGQIKKLLVYVEMDRCAADAIAHVAGVKLGRRSLKFTDYGIMAATFVNLETHAAFRVLSTEEARDLVALYAPGVSGKTRQQLEAYRRMPDSVLFRVQQVQVPVRDWDLPGPTHYKAICSRCGQVVRDRREVLLNGEILCKPCAGGAYFNNGREVSWPDMNWVPTSAALSHPVQHKQHLPHRVETKGRVPKGEILISHDLQNQDFSPRFLSGTGNDMATQHLKDMQTPTTPKS